MNPRTWTPDQLLALQRLYSSSPSIHLAAAFDVPVEELERKARSLALHKSKAAFPGTEKMPRWSSAEKARFLKLYPDHSNIELGILLGRSASSIAAMAHRLNLRKTPERLETMGRANRSLRRPKENDGPRTQADETLAADQ